MLYLSHEYHRSEEVDNSILARVNDMKYPGDNRSIQKASMLTMENIRRDLDIVRMQSRLDVFFIGPRVFTVDEHEAYLKAKMKHEYDRALVAKLKKPIL